ncbi:MAG: murein hydrolase activator EnvC family protein [Candidatus Azotimanducaceae bacterium]|uniref:M23ase beta-sheet core domain-containing protein n=1 Tax=OM182 bacterium TaxID=2510334 RepID=A0A520S270_9GAMM|nr:hypothetical protein [Gammaproteobacteria bacterium]OUV67742.1 MAG: hypothetical protein CBC93_04220 [Gammaproteobacteria bacterium TMED133]RZO76577.1 MAG: hypothetical protein EVA68_03960 [OM182 bacterium]
MKKIFTLLIVLYTTIPIGSNSQASDAAEDLKNQIKTMENEIQKHEGLLQDTQEKHTELEKDLEKSEKAINRLEKEISTIKKKIESRELQISLLLTRKREIQVRRERQENRMNQQIQAAYKLGKQEALKLILNQKNPAEISRTLAYFEYINEARTEEINNFLSTMNELEIITEELAMQTSNLKNVRGDFYQEQIKLNQAKDQKTAALNSLTQFIAETGNGLRKLQQDRRRIEKLLIKLDRSDVSTAKNAITFERMKGQLSLPVIGEIGQKFGANRNVGRMQWNGLFINAPEGEPIYAIHSGKIVFADWLRGFGLLIIINHGQGYMSLYAHNQKINYQSGDLVLAGEIIANVGNTGGQTEPGLYFEIRINGSPTDPQTWCQARNKRAA